MADIPFAQLLCRECTRQWPGTQEALRVYPSRDALHCHAWTHLNGFGPYPTQPFYGGSQKTEVTRMNYLLHEHNLPVQMGQLEPLATDTEAPIYTQTNINGVDVDDVPGLPRYIDPKEAGWRLEAYCRSVPGGVSFKNLYVRMGETNPLKWKAATLPNRMMRAREELGLLPWTRRSERVRETEAIVAGKLTQQQLDRNTSWIVLESGMISQPPPAGTTINWNPTEHIPRTNGTPHHPGASLCNAVAIVMDLSIKAVDITGFTNMEIRKWYDVLSQREKEEAGLYCSYQGGATGQADRVAEKGIPYAEMTVKSLKTALKSRGLKLAGSKTELIERLQFHEARNWMGAGLDKTDFGTFAKQTETSSPPEVDILPANNGESTFFLGGDAHFNENVHPLISSQVPVQQAEFVSAAPLPILEGPALSATFHENEQPNLSASGYGTMNETFHEDEQPSLLTSGAGTMDEVPTPAHYPPYVSSFEEIFADLIDSGNPSNRQNDEGFEIGGFPPLGHVSSNEGPVQTSGIEEEEHQEVVDMTMPESSRPSTFEEILSFDIGEYLR